ncbi:hypothetical protein [Rhizobium hidalgonense]|uniref:hypothetical protein n=1 Tax=Rhizobium hidalgonense TaxID=1538159 RepID=UPI0028718941|nr:hypothetical protein [Rhizobium hidalgonense]MDR9813750.1 hypothetical protein [Rhizobium hidalgonense]
MKISPIQQRAQDRGAHLEVSVMHREISKTTAPKQPYDDDVALLKARIAELEAEVDSLEEEVVDLLVELEAEPDPGLLADIRSDLEKGDVEFALVRIGRAIGWC